MNPTERRALLLLFALLIGALVIDLIIGHRPEWMALLVGEERLLDLMAAGSEEPPVRVAPAKVHLGSAAPDRKRAQPQPRTDRKLPYDEAGRLDLNRADSTELVLLNGVGPVLAGRILEYRRRLGGFGGTGDLLGVRGIGPKTLAKLLPQITLGSVSDSLRVTPAAP